MKKADFRWPKKGDDPFPANVFTPQSRTWVNLEWRKWNFNDSSFAQAFKDAADTIIKQLGKKGNRRYPDMLFMSVASLYRHSLELQLKQIIKLGINLEVVEDNDQLQRALSRHDLYKLWNLVKNASDKVVPGSSSTSDFSAAERIIQRFHSIDRSGQGLRYSKNSSGQKSSSDLPKFVELKHLQEVFDSLFNFLVAIEHYLTEALDTLSDMRSSGY